MSRANREPQGDRDPIGSSAGTSRIAHSSSRTWLGERLSSLEKLRSRLVMLVLLGAIPGLVLVFYDAIEKRRVEGASAQAELVRLGRLVANTQRQLIEDAHVLLSTLARLPQFRGEHIPECQGILASIREQFPRYTNLGVADLNGKVFCSAVPLRTPIQIADRDYFRGARASGGLSVGSYQIGRITGKPAINIGYPIYDRSGTARYVIYVALDLRWMQQIASNVKLPDGSVMTLLDRGNRVLARFPDPEHWAGRQIRDWPPIETIRHATEGALEATGLDGMVRLFAYHALESEPGPARSYLLIGVNRDSVYAEANRALRRNLIVLGLIVLVTLTAAWVGGEIFVLRPINSVLRAVRRLAAGDLSARVGHAGGRDELAELARGFDDMADKLELRTRETLDHAKRIARLNHLYAVLSGINSTIVRLRDRRGLLEEACRIGVEVGGFRLAWAVLRSPGDKPATHAVHGASPDAGISPDSLTAATLDLVPDGALHIVERLDAPGVPAPIQELARQSGTKSLIILPIHLQFGDVGAFALGAADTGAFDADEVRLLEEVAGDISFGLEHIQQQEQVHRLAYFDALTNLANRQLFMDRLAQALSREQYHHRHTAAMMLRLVRFKEINSLHGQHIGDQVLQHVARWLERVVRPGDTVARVGSSTFGVILVDLARPQDAALVAQKIINELQTPVTFGNREVFIHIVIGIAVSPEDGEDADTVARHAESALHLSQRHQTSGGFEYFSPDINREAAERTEIENALRHAITRDELFLNYQPIVELDSQRIIGAEVLLRWNHPTLGQVPPSRFIPIAENSGLIVELGDWVLQRACADARLWAEQGWIERLSINVSVHQLRREDFESRLDRALNEAKLDPKKLRVMLEITETEMMQFTEGVLQQLDRIRARGISIAIDDFGTGYSSLSYLQNLAVDALKIDVSFVRVITDAEAEPPLVRSIIALAHSLGKQVVAEGVETPVQHAVLQRLGCRCAQGYLFGRPMPAADFSKRLDESNQKKGF